MKRALDSVMRDEEWLRQRIEQAALPVRAPRGFAQRVMNEVYREAVAGRPAAAEAAPGAPVPLRVSRLYRRVGLSFMITAAVLAVSLLVPRGSYGSLIEAAAGKALGPGPSNAVETALSGAASAVQGALGERVIGGGM